MVQAPYRTFAAGILAMVDLLLAGAAGWIANGWRHGAEIDELQHAHAEFRATLCEKSLADVQADASTIRKTAAEFGAIQSTLAPKMTALTKELRNGKPLPMGCAPDQQRVRNPTPQSTPQQKHPSIVPWRRHAHRWRGRPPTTSTPGSLGRSSCCASTPITQRAT